MKLYKRVSYKKRWTRFDDKKRRTWSYHLTPPMKILEGTKERLLEELGDIQSTATISFCEL